MEEDLTDDWHEFYVASNLCTLCGNRGTIDSRGVKTRAGVEVGRLNWCICPNGQALRRHAAAGAAAQEIGVTVTGNPWMHIAVNHDRSKPAIGRMRQVGYRLEVELFQPMTMAQVFQIFGGAGLMITEATIGTDGQIATISKFDIPEFSYCPQPLSRAPGTLGEILVVAKRCQMTEWITELEKDGWKPPDGEVEILLEDGTIKRGVITVEEMLSDDCAMPVADVRFTDGTYLAFSATRGYRKE